MTKPEKTLLEKIESLEAVVSVVGLGYVGSPHAGCVRSAVYTMLGIDRFLGGPPPNFAGLERFSMSNDYSVVGEYDIITVCVPAPLTDNETLDLSILEEAIDSRAGNFSVEGESHRPKLIEVESISFPGTTSELVLPRLAS